MSSSTLHSTVVTFVLLVGLIVSNGVVAGGSTSDKAALNTAMIKAGRSKAQGCTRCHGRVGLKQLAERSQWSGTVGAFITRELVAFREKYRLHPVMNSVAAPLTDEDILQISSWFDSLTSR